VAGEAKVNEAKSVVTDTVKRSRKSVNKAIEKTADAANIALPESPANLYVYTLVYVA
jgi:hypothetical protein